MLIPYRIATHCPLGQAFMLRSFGLGFLVGAASKLTRLPRPNQQNNRENLVCGVNVWIMCGGQSRNNSFVVLLCLSLFALCAYCVVFLMLISLLNLVNSWALYEAHRCRSNFVPLHLLVLYRPHFQSEFIRTHCHH